MLGRIFSHSALHTGAHLGYFSGIAMLVPILSSAWENHIRPWIAAPMGFIIAIGLVILSLVLLGFVAGSVSSLFRGIGWMMMIPGVLAVLFAGFGQVQVYGWAEQHITGFAGFEPVLSWLVEHSVPKAAYLGGAYILIGSVLLWIGRVLNSFSRFI